MEGVLLSGLGHGDGGKEVAADVKIKVWWLEARGGRLCKSSRSHAGQPQPGDDAEISL